MPVGRIIDELRCDSGPADGAVVIIGFCLKHNLMLFCGVGFHLRFPAKYMEKLLLSLRRRDEGGNLADQLIHILQILHSSGILSISAGADPFVCGEIHVKHRSY